MLKPESDRISYAAELTPPDGYRLERAVATTYSLDLETIVAAAIPLGLSQELDGNELTCPVGLLHAIRKISDRIVIFCEASQVKYPEKSNKLFPLLDAMVVPVAMRKRKGRFPAFHPKTWALQFVNIDDETDRVYRYIVLSRNLTFDRSWDVAVSLDGREENRNVAHSRPLVEFLEFLIKQVPQNGHSSGRQKSVVRALMRDLAHVRFAIDRKEFDGFEFLPSGFGEFRGLGATQLFCADKGTYDCTFHDLVVVSPFVSPEVVHQWNDPVHNMEGTRRVLITRQEALNGLQQNQIENFDTYVLKDAVVSGEESLSDGETTTSQKQDIHAKAYLWRKWSNYELFLGSANATLQGTGLSQNVVQNVEMMIRLWGKNRYLNGDLFLRDLFCGDIESNSCPFEPGTLQHSPENDDLKSNEVAERAIKEFCRCNVRANVLPDGDLYSIGLEIPEVESFRALSIAPLCAIGLSRSVEKMMKFAQLKAEMLSEFFVVEASADGTSLRRVVQIPIANMPDQRDAAVLNSIIENKESLCKYLAMVFSENPAYALCDYERTLNSLGNEERSTAYMLSGVYEEMLKAAVNDPQRIRDAGRVLKYLSADVADLTSFKELYAVFAAVLKIPVEESPHG